MSKESIGVIVLGVAVLAVGFLNYAKDPVNVVVTDDGDTRVIERQVGGFPGPDVYQNMFFHAGLTYGSSCYSTSTSGVITASSLERNSCIYIDALSGAQATIAITLPASTTLDNVLAFSEGGCRTWWIDASDVVAATTTTMTAGTGWNLVGYDNDDDVIEGAKYGALTACREEDGDVTGFLSEFVAAD